MQQAIFTIVLSATLTVILTTSGCSKKEEPPPATPPPQASAPAAPQSPPAPAPAPASQAPASDTPAGAPAPAAAPAAQAPVAPAAAVLASADGETPGFRVEVQELKRVSGGTVMLRFAMINDSDKDLDFGYRYSAKEHEVKDFNGIGGTHLIDPVGKKKYLVVRDTDNNCVCSKGLSSVKPKSRINVWARFPAPPDNVEKIGIVVPHFSPMDDVPLGR